MVPALIFGVSCNGLRPDFSDQAVARRLASSTERMAAVREVAGAGGAQLLPRLIAWTTSPPADIDRTELNIGLADAFGEVKAVGAIPFLIRNLAITRYRAFPLDPWVRKAPVIEAAYPAVGALVKIGASSSEPLMRAARGRLTPDERLCALFALAQINDPSAQEFLNGALGKAGLEQYWLNDALRALHVECLWQQPGVRPDEAGHKVR